MLPLLIGLGAGAGLGALKGQKNKEKDIQDALERKAVIMYSPWTHMNDPGKKEREDVLESMLSGGAKGAMLGSLAGSFGGAAAPTTPVDTNTISPSDAAQKALEDSIFGQENYIMGNPAAQRKWSLGFGR
jgi:hypothetical protein